VVSAVNILTSVTLLSPVALLRRVVLVLLWIEWMILIKSLSTIGAEFLNGAVLADPVTAESHTSLRTLVGLALVLKIFVDLRCERVERDWRICFTTADENGIFVRTESRRFDFPSEAFWLAGF
jgi:hypothetical protein